MVSRDWIAWHAEYDQPESSLARRLVCVRSYIRQALAVVENQHPAELQITSICAGDGRDLLPVVAERPVRRPMSITLIELDPLLAERAQESARHVAARVQVRQADAGDVTTYADLSRADILLACGVFGNVSREDAHTTIRFLPRLLNPSGIVIWTRGRADDGDDPSADIRRHMQIAGFTELAFTAPQNARFRVGMNQLRPGADPDPDPPERVFSFG